MQIDVALTPALSRDSDRSICIVVDVLRASSACVAMFDAGIEAIAIASDPDAARSLRASQLPGALLCGEVGGLPPAGFDYGNSPVEFSRLDLSGRQAVLATSNGTRALHAVVASPCVLVGCLLNRDAVAVAAFDKAAGHDAAVQIVCAGNDYGATVSLDDAVTAGAIAARLATLVRAAGDEALLSDAALMAVRLFDSFDADAGRAFRDGMHGQTLDRLGFAPDLDFCAALDRSHSVPLLTVERDGLLMLRQGG